jgi:hypothetical protein
MYCASCASGDLTEFTAEMNINLSGHKNLDKPGVLVFPKVWVCLECGFSRFTTPRTDLRLLAQGTLTDEPTAWDGSVGNGALPKIAV